MGKRNEEHNKKTKKNIACNEICYPKHQKKNTESFVSH
jgi:hypothetical protein